MSIRSIRLAVAPAVAPAVAIAVATALAPPAFSPLRAQEPSRIFEAHAAGVFKVEVLEGRSSAPYVIGTAFVVDEDGTLITNYHVVNDVVFSPDRYSMRLVDRDGGRVEEVEVIAVDPAHDLAVLRATGITAPPLRLADELPAVGAPVYSLGYPRDLAATVVEGSFGGPMAKSLLGQFHFTGSLNPGMSGGPTVIGDGSVVGVNVATSGNQLSYLVPAGRATELLELARAGSGALLDQATASLMGVQATLRDAVLGAGIGTAEFEGYELPAPSEDMFSCNAVPLQSDDVDYEGLIYRCELDDALFLDPDEALPLIGFEHVVISAEGLRPIQFAGLLSSWHNNVGFDDAPESDWVTPYICDGDNVRNGHELRLRTVQCWRRRPDLPGTYDLFFRATPLGRTQPGVVSTYRMFGASRENGLRLIEAVVAGTRVAG